jgi:methylenetetrahydrofolate reductase (NADPH)
MADESTATQGSADPKIIDLINARSGEDEAFVSLEFFPPRTKEGVKNLYSRMERMKENTNPLFTDITWGAGGSTADLSLDLALHMHQTGHVANMHLTCTNMDASVIRDALQKCKEGGIRNIVALRGDPPEGESEWTATEGGFTCALDLVRYMRKEFGDFFGIAVAGYPEGHPNAITDLSEEEVGSMTESEKQRCSVINGVTAVCKDEDYKKEMDYLKEKVDAGADLIITQMFFDVEVFQIFVKDCRDHGIHCPIIPGLMCINAYAGFRKMIGFCKTRVPPSLEEKMESIKGDKDAVKKFGIEFGAEVCQKLIDGGAPGLHFYTLNLEKVVYGTLDTLGITQGLLDRVNEKDAASMVAKGSAWAKKGDTVKCDAGQGTVVEIRADGSAAVEIDGKQVEVAKGSYEKLGNVV